MAIVVTCLRVRVMNPANSKLVGIVKFFICVGAMAAAFYDQTILFYKQTNSFLCFFFGHVNAISVIPPTKKHQAIRTRWSSLRSKSRRFIPAAWYLRNNLLLWYDLKLFIVWLQLAAVRRLLNGLGLSSIPLEEKVECYKSGPLALQL